MWFRCLFLSCVFIVAPALATSDEVTDPLAAQALTVAIEQGRDRPDSPYHLLVNCMDKQAVRALEVFPGGVAIWNRKLQISLPWSIRSELLGLLLRDDYPTFAPLYGEQNDLEDVDGAMRVSCQIELEIGTLKKHSAQLYDGPQSANFAALAAALLDKVQPLAAQGVEAKDLRDGLNKLAEGVLAPQVFTLRYVEIPARGQQQPGFILRINDAMVSRQAYTPGKVLAEPSRTVLADCRFQHLMAAIDSADLPDLPVNLWSQAQIELEVQVLAHRKTLMARPFTRLRSDIHGPEQQRFDTLLGVIRTLGLEDQAACVGDIDRV